MRSLNYPSMMIFFRFWSTFSVLPASFTNFWNMPVTPGSRSVGGRIISFVAVKKPITGLEVDFAPRHPQHGRRLTVASNSIPSKGIKFDPT